MKHGKKPTYGQKVTLGKLGLSPENWLVISGAKTGLVIIHKHSNQVRKIPAEILM